ncbi:glycosyltransferase family A protein [Aurantiacibacter sp. MUD11]|uniref:glycosyltransferase family A protein n=1 Tax=Aurantiacibacter sp. MUD11 TaxID=3003265 RepID=UPI0022AA1B2D|nr:glycosyltransferase family A protein [Aurantiacibacter sp. MUD11]WAT18941.1 glycosyltransferase family A protein [Aurantiacibacter sp. MUD11]
MNAVSVIIPVHNGERFVGEAIESALCQSLGPMEVVVVDDGSTDNSADIARSFGDKVRCFVQACKGPAAARNHGIAQARGQILAFLDADDLWLEDKLAAQVPMIGEYDLAFTLIEKFRDPDCPDGVGEAATETAQPGLLPTTMVCRASAFEQIGGFDEDLRGGELIDWLDRGREAGLKELMVPRVLARRRIHADNLTWQSTSREAYLQVIAKKLQRARKGADRG